MPLTKLTKNVYLVTPSTPPVYPYSNSLYIEDERSVVIDLGAGGNAFAEIPAWRVELCLLSHFHFDHVHGDGLFPDASLYAGREEVEAYRDKAAYYRFFGFDLWESLMPGIPQIAFADAIARALPADVLARPGFREIPLAGTIKDGDVFDLGKRRVTAVHLPGHTAGHYGFYLEDEGILFSGDIDLASTGPWYYGVSSDLTQLMASVRRVQEIGPGMLVPSHRRVFTEGISEGLERYMQVVHDREGRLLEALRTPQTLKELAGRGIIFPEWRNVYEMFWEQTGLMAHLRRLVELGAAGVSEEGCYFLK